MITLTLVLAGASFGQSHPKTTNRQLLAQEARQTLQRLPGSQSLKVSWSAAQPTPSQLRGLQLSLPGATARQRARFFLDSYPGLFAGQELTFADLQQVSGRQLVRFQQHYQGLEVLGAQAILAFDSAGRLIGLSSSVVPAELPTTRPAFAPARAVTVAAAQLGRVAPLTKNTAQRARLIVLAEGRARLAYKVILPFALDRHARVHLVDATTGAYLGWRRGALIDRPQAAQEVSR